MKYSFDMKKQILFIISLALFLGISCTKETSKKQEVTQLAKAVKTAVKINQKNTTVEVKSTRSTVALKNNSNDEDDIQELDLDEIKKEINNSINTTLGKYFK